MLGKMLIMQQYFGGRCYDQLCAVSNDAQINRTSIPRSINKLLVKAESIGPTVERIIKAHSTGAFFKGNPSFTRDELYKIMYFLTDQHCPASTSNSKNGEALTTSMSAPQSNSETTTAVSPEVQIIKGFECKSCGSFDTSPKYGKYGYYVTCPSCKVNTAMKIACSHCGSKRTKVSKSKNTYTVSCECGHKQQHVF